MARCSENLSDWYYQAFPFKDEHEHQTTQPSSVLFTINGSYINSYSIFLLVSSATIPVMIRYGYEEKSNYFSFTTEGETKSRCSNFNGDPSKGNRKKCWYQEDVSSLPTSWRKCADENKSGATGSDEPLWIKYSTSSSNE